LKFLLDTHIVIWWLFGETQRLSKQQSRVLASLEQSAEPAAISAITLWELAMLRERGRVRVKKSLDDLLGDIDSHSLIRILPLSCAIAAESVRLGDFHRDPADQIIVATARCHDLTLVTADDRIRGWGKVRVL
jgi:PIN domain nuclease of toxin-antitoxin system